MRCEEAPLHSILSLSAAIAAAMLSGCGEPAVAPAAPPAAALDEAKRIAAIVDPLITADLASSGTPGAAFVFVRGGRIVYQRGYGRSDLTTQTVVDPEQTVWPMASITKALTAMAALQLVAAGKVDLDADINRYLKRLQVPSQGYGPLTLRHILSHRAGLDELPGRQFDGSARPDLAAFIKSKLVRYRAPGGLTAYSTYGIVIAGLMIEDVSGETYADYVREHIFAPAGMTRARFMIARGDERGVATPYTVEDGRAKAVPHEWYVTTPASSMVASAADMGRLLLVHLEDGAAGGRPILPPPLIRAMHRQQATVHPDVPGWSLGLQLDRANGLDLAEHGGDIAGFASLFTVVPELNAGFFIVHHGEGGDLRFRVKEALLDAVHPPAAPPAVPRADPRRAASMREYAGRYISTLACRTCRAAEADVFALSVEPDGTLSLWGQRWVPLRRDLFIRDDGRRLLGFARDQAGRIVSLSAGSWRVADRL
jgi:CubicO group peptidase (beta-lactamase class C family)